MSLKVLLLGATGLIGKNCLEQLSLESQISKIICLGRRKPLWDGLKIEPYVVHFTELENCPVDLFKVDVVICCLGTTIKKAGSQQEFRKLEIDQTLAIAKKSREQGCGKFIIVTSLGAHYKSSNFYLRIKGEIEEKLKGLGFSSLTILRPSLLLGSRSERRIGEEIGKWLTSPLKNIKFMGFDKVRPVEARSVARSIVKEALAKSEGVRVIPNEEILS